MKFLDQVEIIVESGKGGAGSTSFRREKFVPRGGPDGGDGGKGGDLIFFVNPGVNTLLHLSNKKLFKAQSGVNGAENQKTGANGEDLIIEVPEGTVVKDENGELLLDLKEKNQKYIFLKGGRGGKGNTFFKSSINQAPTKAQPGEEGERKSIALELKLMADVGLIGYPNVGKSTLISVVSAAKPKIADYPFTTLTPSLGMVDLLDGKTCVIADIPGLIPGAHKGIGLGTQFLRHISRTRVFLHIIDASPFTDRDSWQDYQDIREELKAHDIANVKTPDYLPLENRKEIVVLNKLDTIKESDAEELAHKFKKHGVNCIGISAISQHGLSELKFKIKEVLYGEKTDA